MMIRFGFAVFFVFLFFAGCQKRNLPGEIFLKVNDYELNKEEFEINFKDSAYGTNDTLESRKKFLDSLIDQKLILQDAQDKNIDKERNFFRLIEKFWEQSLLKLALERRSRQTQEQARVNDAEVRARYEENVKKGELVKPYEEAYAQIRWEVSREKESNLLNDWLGELRKKASIKINSDIN